MKNHMMGCVYPKCSRNNRFYLKHQMQNGRFYIKDKTLVFEPRYLYIFKLRKNIQIPLNQIQYVDNITLNGYMPFGVLVTLKNNKEIMFGYVNNKKLKQFIEDAKNAMIKEKTDDEMKKEEFLRKFLIIAITILIIIFIFKKIG